MTTKNILLALENEVSKNDFNNILKQLIYKKTSSNNELVVFEVNNKYIASFIKTKYTTLLQDILENMIGIKPSIEINLIGGINTQLGNICIGNFSNPSQSALRAIRRY